MKKILLGSLAAGMMVLGTANVASATAFTFSGNIAYHNDVIQISFSLSSDATNVRVWTDSFMSGTNFDPITAVWRQNGGDWDLVGENDDNPTIEPGQTYFDSGLVFATLSAGNYLFTIARFANFAIGPQLSDGFYYSGDNPNPLTGGTFYRVNLDGVDTAADPRSAVPEPASLLLFGTGLVGLVATARRRMRK